ncbi:MAG: head maturation protease, ClpP-related [Acidobacteriota bacterium]
MKLRQWYSVNANAIAAETIAEIYIYGNIGKSFWDDDTVSAKQFVDDLNALPKDVTGVRVHVNSLGGDMFDGLAIANALRDFRVKGRTVETITEGVAASAASLVMMAGSPISIGDNAILMIHDPWGLVVGNSRDMRKAADTFDKFGDQVIATYQWNSELSAEDIAALMAAETWMSADEAIAKGFATEKVTGLQAAASLDRRSFANVKVPEQYRPLVEALLTPAPETPRPAPAPTVEAPAAAGDVLSLVQAAGLDISLASDLVNSALPLNQVTTRIADAKLAKQQEATRVAEIRATCAAQRCDQLADLFIADKLPIESVRAHLTVLTALRDTATIDGSLSPDTSKAEPVIDVFAIYAQLNHRTSKKE